MPSEDEGSTFCPVPARLPFYAAPPFADNIAHFFISTDFPLSVKILSHLSTTGYTQVQDKACGDWGFFRRRQNGRQKRRDIACPAVFKYTFNRTSGIKQPECWRPVCL
ncbi:hypothetical protein A6J50_00190 [Neisseria meningitidis]|nr:hypothetical protein A6J54_10860 [Neisseria meningitidis]ARC09053.1 hypothetical protein A6J50_00190 [Neisseria meningitidis]